MRLRLSLPLLVLAACSSPSRVCTPGAQVECACPAGVSGVQVCASDGQSLGACQCGGSGGGAANGGGAGTGGSVATGGGGAGGGSGTGGSVATGGGSGGGGSACVPVIGGAAPVTADLYLMLDKSASMSDSIGAGTKWDLAGGGIKAFATAPPSAVELGLQYFGQPPAGTSCPAMCNVSGDCGLCGPCFMSVCIGEVPDSCNAADYATPDLEVSPMPAQEGALAASLAAQSPSTSHATSAALRALVDHAQSWAASHRNDAVAGVLITGGQPTECDTNPGNLAAIAASAPPVYVFRLGTVGTVDSVEDGIASAGGTTAAVPVASEADLVNALSDTATALSHCRYQIDAGLGDGGLVHVRQGGALLSRVSSAAACGSSSGWWYGGADVVVLCSASCAVDAGLSAEVGCP